MGSTGRITIRAYEPSDEAWAAETMQREFGGRMLARRGELVDALGFSGLVAEREGHREGLLTYRMGGDDCELVFMIAIEQGTGIGTSLVEALREVASGRLRIWVVTTNDNLRALRFYQRRGFVLRELRPGAVDESRRALKPAISLTGDHDIPIRDELELELVLT